MGVEWSKEQKDVIASEGCDLLVSAAAGSGKTAVLVERIIRIITDEAHPVPASRLLVLTFTNAAAAEMKDRIGKGIDRCLEADPENRWLRRQKSELHFAGISTIHSLCMNLVREHFSVLDIDPSFRVGDETELKLLRQETAEDVLEIFYASGNPEFRRFSDCYGTGKLDGGLIEMLLNVYEAAQGQPSPEIWLERCRQWYEADGRESALEAIGSYITGEKDSLTGEHLRMLESVLSLVKKQPQLEAVVKVLESDIQMVRELAGCSDYQSARDCLDKLAWQRMPSLRKLTAESSAVKEKVMSVRKTVKSELGALYKDFYGRSPEDIAGEFEYLRPFACVLTEMTLIFKQQYDRKKRDRNLIDFSDQEHMALKLLADLSETGDGMLRVEPTQIALAQQDYYAQVICDEYQDTNPVQELLLQLLSASGSGRHDRFMVGDVKQSIYRFRQADASIFMHKYDTYTPADKADGHTVCKRIDLHRNFRSREIILESTNYLFRQLMTRSFAGIDYDDDAALRPGRVFPEEDAERVSVDTEVVLVDYDEELLENNELTFTQVELEAEAVASEIRELTDPDTGMRVLDDETGTYRPAGYGDIVILLRTMAGWARPMASVLMQENIPVSVEISEGFFAAPEIQTMLAMLSVIDNPRQDIPLAAVLASPAAGLTPEEMAVMRAACPDGGLYDALVMAASEGSEKCGDFLRMLEDFRLVSRFMAADELLLYIYDKTGYYDYVQVLPQGDRRRANLDVLVERAAVYAAGSMSGLFNFIRYIEQIKEQKMDFGEAAAADQAKNCVRLISIHKSKGLEYPIVILAGLGKSFNMSDGRGSMVIHPAFGFGLDAFNPENRRRLPSAFKKFIAARQRQETLAEELRILYVAMTRAKEHLVMTGTLKKPDEKLEKYRQTEGNASSPLPPGILRGAGCFLDWVLACICRDESQILFRIRTYTPGNFVKDAVDTAVTHHFDRQKLMSALEEADDAGVKPVLDRLDADAAWVYPWQDAAGKKEKYSVSELKKADFDEAAQTAFREPASDQVPDPEAMKKAAFRGTAFHRVMELIDFENVPDAEDLSWVRDQISLMTQTGRLDEQQAEVIRIGDAAGLLWGSLGRRMSAAAREGKLKREVPFMAGVPSFFVDRGPDPSYEPDDREDLVIIQGVIDACFEENGEIIIVDYKTDAVSPEDGEEQLKKRYSKQLDYYAFAMKRMGHKEIADLRIYSTRLRRDFSLKD